nr:Toll/interleukin-1 receptor (TIR) domain-containing protein [Tanacetum cinerariifolium]
MASTSVSSIQKSFKYDVFLSFRGEDTRKNFVDHLYYALTQKGIETYKDDEKIKQGKMISDELIKAIEDSKFYIIVFSKNYASSSWCLEELVKIMECQTMDEHTAYPVFYDVEPTEVRKQSGSVGDAFARHKEDEAARKWREALEEASDLAGWELKIIANGHEAKFIQKIVEEISLELRFINSSTDGDLVGMETRVNEVISSLEPGVGDVRMLGIWGMGGAGKTTLARAVFDQISFQFEGKSFVENVREESKPSLSGLKSLQEQVLSDILNDQGVTVSGVFDGKNKIKKAMGVRKVLVVLDDVDHKDQIEALTGDCNWFNPGSRIIITTRDKQVLTAHGVELIQNVTLLSEAEAGCLLSRYAFGRENPIQGYQELSGKVLQYAGGLPLTIKVMGSHLRGLDESEWKNAIKRLETIPFKDTMKVLELSYDGLEEDCKQIFLDVACILKGWEKEYAIRVLESRGFYGIYGLRVLEQRSLVTYDEDGRLGMHDHIEEMGRNIVRRSHPDEPQRHSRLWDKEEIEHILLTNKLGTPATQCLKLWSSGFSAEVAIKGLAKLKDLKVLDIRVSVREYLYEMRWWGFDKDREYLPSSLRYMRWDYFPFPSLPNTFHGKHLVGLEMEWSNIILLWEDGEEKVLYNLRFLTISRSKVRTFDLGLAPNLEQLTIQYCCDFVELHIPADHCLKLEHLDLDLTYSKLTNLHLGNAPNLKTLKLEGCYDLVELEMPSECLKLEKLYLRHSKLKTIHLGSTPNLMELILEGCNDLVELEMPAENIKLALLYLSGSKLKTIHLGSTPNLEELILDGCDVSVELEKPAESLKLAPLNVRDSKLKTIHLGSTPNLEELILDGCSDLVELEMPAESLKLTRLNLRYSKLKTIHLGSTPNLEELILNGCNDLVELEMPSECLKLKELNLSHSKLTIIDLGLTPNLIRLNLENCYNLVEIKAPKDRGLLECLKELIFTSTRITHFPENIFMSTHLKSLKLKSCWHLEKLPEDLGRLECLEKLELIECIYLRHIPSSICQLKSLKYFQLPYCFLVEKLPEEIGSLIQLEELNIEGTGISHLPRSIFQLKRLRIVGFTWQLRSYGFRSVIQTSTYVAFSYTSYHSSANRLEKQVFDFARKLQSCVNKNKRRWDC